MTRLLAAVALWWISLSLSCWILQRASAAPFLSKMSLTFRRNSLVRLSYFDALESHTIVLKLKRRGGGQDTSTLTSSSNAPTTTVTAADTLATATISTPLNETTASDVLTDSKEESVPYNFSLFQKGDGSETDPDGIPGRWLRMQKGHREKAKEALQATLKWEETKMLTLFYRNLMLNLMCANEYCHITFREEMPRDMSFLSNDLEKFKPVLPRPTMSPMMIYYITMSLYWNIVGMKLNRVRIKP